MAKLAKWLWFTFAALFTSAALAQSPEPRSRVVFAQPELDQMLAPIALYPDALLSQVLMAATYPRDLAEAASWSRANGRLQGDEAVRAVEREPWDPSVMSLVAFPELLEMMDERRDWTRRLGDAFLAQPDDVMDTVQDLRRRADAAGHLRSGEEMVVQRQGDDYVIEPPTPDIVYVPYYDPYVVYGDWWWPRYEPVFWNPWPSYRWHSGYRGLAWGYGIRLGHGFFFGAFDWRHRYVRYASHRPWYYHGRDWRGGDRWNWRGGDGRRDRDGRWNRDGRGDRDGRWNRDGRDGRGDRDGRWTRGDGRSAGTDAAIRGERQRTPAAANAAPSPAPALANQQGFFPPRAENPVARSAPVNPGVRAAAPRYGTEGPRYERHRQQATQAPEAPAVRVAPRQSTAPQAPAIVREAPASRAPSARIPVERSAPVHAAPVQRAAPVERSAPAPRQSSERSAPRESSERSAPSRSESSNPASRGGDRGGRSRDR